MYSCRLNIALVGFSKEIFDYMKNNSQSLFGEQYTIVVDRFSRLNGKIIAEANMIFAEISENIEDILLMYNVNKKADTQLIVTMPGAQLQKALASRYVDCIDDIWPYGINSEMFAFKYVRWVESVKNDKEAWLCSNYLENVIDATEDLVWFKDKEGSHLKVNNSFCNAVNKTKEEVKGRGHYYIWDITPEEYAQGEYVCMESEHEVMDKRKTCWFDEDVLVHGEIRKFLTCKAPLFNIDGSVMGTVGVARDITKELEYKRRLQEELMSTKIELKKDGLTGIYNRIAYTDDVKRFDELFNKHDFVYISLDINGLKSVNDKLGQEAGDEMIKATAMCMSACFSVYGKIYRIGGDEFAAMLNADRHDLVRMMRDFENMMYNWSGDAVKQLSIAYGYVTSDECADMSIVDMKKAAEAKMYEAKAAYYERKGIDRRGREELMDVMKNSYLKVLRVNLSSDACQIIKADEQELMQNSEFDERLSTWIKNFLSANRIADEDVETFSSTMDIVNLREHFRDGKNYLKLYYKRLVNDVYRNSLLEIVTSKDYSEDNQIVYLYVKAID